MTASPRGEPPSDRDPLARLEAEALTQLAANRDRPYYDLDVDAVARDAYYAGVDLDVPPAELQRALHRLLEETHVRPRDYRPSVELYPWVDVQPDGHLRHIYSGLRLDPEEAIRVDTRIARQRAARVSAAIHSRPTMGTRDLHELARTVTQELHFNCEHVVPQSWFDEREPMRGDLHHLFTCQPSCNSLRGHKPFAELSDSQQLLTDCGRILGEDESATFEPLTGKGAVARATLYFLLRYPGRIEDPMRERTLATVPTLLAWHALEPVTQYELHRNAAIAEAQGNRNPLIDFPDLAGRVGFGSAA